MTHLLYSLFLEYSTKYRTPYSESVPNTLFREWDKYRNLKKWSAKQCVHSITVTCKWLVLSEIETLEGGLSIPVVKELTPTSDKGQGSHSARSSNRLNEKRNSAVGKKTGKWNTPVAVGPLHSYYHHNILCFHRWAVIINPQSAECVILRR